MTFSYKKMAVLLMAVMFIGACNIIPEPAQTRLYPLPTTTQLDPVATTYDGSLRVAQPAALQSLDVARLSVIRADGRQAYWQDVRLQDRLPLVVQASLIEGLTAAGVAHHIVTDSAGAAYDVALHSSIEQFAIIEGEQWQARVSIRFQLQQGRDRRVIGSRQIRATEDLTGRDISSALDALSAANREVQLELAAWLADELN